MRYAALRFHFPRRRDKNLRRVDSRSVPAGREDRADVGGGESLPTLMIPEEAFSPRTVAQVQGVLKRVKSAALKEGEDPESPDFERTPENSESPALLGGAQILVDGGRLIFERSDGDLPLAAGLWLLLPEATRVRLWPTSFAFSAELEFDLLDRAPSG